MIDGATLTTTVLLLALATAGQPLPDGTILTMEVYKARLDARGEF